MDQEDQLVDPAYRQNLIREIKGSENRERLENSSEEWDVYTGNIEGYVERELLCRFERETVREMPIVSAVNILKKVVDNKASLYTKEPERTFTNLSDDQLEVVERVYDDANADFSFNESNKLYELQKKQTHILVDIKNGKIIFKPIKAHMVNVVPNNVDAEKGVIYIFSGYDRSLNENYSESKGQDNVNQDIADYDDHKASNERYVVWSEKYHFVMDGNGSIVSGEDVENKIGVIPVVEVSALKDFNYWRELTNDVAKFCVDYNVALTSLNYVVEMQGFAQAYLKGPKDLMPTNIQVGPSKILKLITNPDEEGDIEFGFATPGSDLAGSQAFVESLLAQFLSSQGVDASTVSGSAQSDKYTSGVERLLAQIEKFEASKEVMSLYRHSEAKVYNVVKAMLNNFKGTEILSEEYYTADLPESSKLRIKYAEPQSVISETDRLDIIERKKDLGILDQIGIIAEYENISRGEARDLLAEQELDREEPLLEEII